MNGILLFGSAGVLREEKEAGHGSDAEACFNLINDMIRGDEMKRARDRGAV